MASASEAFKEYGIQLTPWENLPKNADAVIVAVSHKQYLDVQLDEILRLLRPNGLFIDVKSKYDSAKIRSSGRKLWRL